MGEIWKGAPVAAALCASLTGRISALRAAGVEPALAILRAGERGDDIAYENGAVKRCEKLGIAVRRVRLPAGCTKEEVLKAIRQVNADDGIHGCLLLRPLADRAAEEAACETLLPEKDVDGITPGSLAGVFAGGGRGYPPCTAQACMEVLDYYGCDPAGRRAAVIGRSLVIGRPVSMLLQRRNATVTMCHSRTADLPAVCRQTEILVAAAGQSGLVDAGFLAPGQVVLDVGINVGPEGGLQGDVDFQGAIRTAGAVTPVPGGVGAVTTAVLAKHVVEAAERTLSCGP